MLPTRGDKAYTTAVFIEGLCIRAPHFANKVGVFVKPTADRPNDCTSQHQGLVFKNVLGKYLETVWLVKLHGNQQGSSKRLWRWRMNLHGG